MFAKWGSCIKPDDSVLPENVNMVSTSWLLDEMDDRERADAIASVRTHESEKLAAEFGVDRERLRTILERGLTACAGEPLRRGVADAAGEGIPAVSFDQSYAKTATDVGRDRNGPSAPHSSLCTRPRSSTTWRASRFLRT